jgi:hypothetical protein
MKTWILNPLSRVSAIIVCVGLLGCDTGAPSRDTHELDDGSTSAIDRELAEILSIQDGRAERAFRWGRLLKSASVEEIEHVVDILEPDIDAVPSYELRTIVDSWSRHDANAALDRALQWRMASSARSVGVGRAIRVMAMSNPIKAVHTVVSISTSDKSGLGRSATLALARGWIDGGELAGASRFLAKMPKEYNREDLTFDLAKAWLAAEGPAAVKAWAEGVPEDTPGNYRGTAFRKAALVLEANDRADALDWLAEHETQWYGAAGARMLARQWARTDPLEAMAWAASLEGERSRHFSVSFGFQGWYEEDPEAARSWLLAQSGSAVWDPARSRLVDDLSRVERYEQSLEAAQQVIEPRLRDEMIAKALAEWQAADTKAAQRWLEQNSISDSIEHAAATRADQLRRLEEIRPPTRRIRVVSEEPTTVPGGAAGAEQ